MKSSLSVKVVVLSIFALFSQQVVAEAIAPKTINCTAPRAKEVQCAIVGNVASVQLIRETGKKKCEDRWSYSSNVIRVRRRCGADFKINFVQPVATGVTDAEVPVDYPRNAPLEQEILAALGASPLTIDEKAQHIIDRMGYGAGTTLHIRELVRFTNSAIDKAKSHRAILRYMMHSLNSGYLRNDTEDFLKRNFPTSELTYDQISTLTRNFSVRNTESAKVLADAVKEMEKGSTPAREAALLSAQNRRTEIVTENNNNRSNLQAAAQARLISNAVIAKYGLGTKLAYLWFNRFNVSSEKAVFDLNDYMRMLSSKSKGKFEDLLISTARHPAMLIYLNNFLSRGKDSKGNPMTPNEDYGRELMELHSLGIVAGTSSGVNSYNLNDVRSAAKILTGWSVDGTAATATGTRRYSYIPAYQAVGSKSLLGKTFPEGEQGGVEFLKYLANHPLTARSVSRMLTQYFVTDRMGDKEAVAIVNDLTADYAEVKGDLKQLYGRLFTHPSFWSKAAFRSKVKDPLHQVVSFMRVRGVVMKSITAADVKTAISATNAMGQVLFNCIPPTGYPIVSAQWASVNNVLMSVRQAFGFASFGGESKTTTYDKYLDYEEQVRKQAIAKNYTAASTALMERLGWIFGLVRTEDRYNLPATKWKALTELAAQKPDRENGSDRYMRTPAGLAMGSLFLSVY